MRHGFIAASDLLRDGVFLKEGCIIGPAVELKTTFMFRGSKAAHLNFIDDVKRRAKVTPYRRAKLTPLAQGFAVARRRSAEPLAERSA